MFRRLGITVLLPGIVLLLLGLRTIEQDRLTLDRQILDRLQNAAQLASGGIDQQLAVWQQFRGDGITLTDDGGKLAPAERSAYEVADDAPQEEPLPALAEAERREFHGDLEKAAELYRRAIVENPQA